jgi:hypothetical protein
MMFIIDSNKNKKRRMPRNVKWLKGDETVLAHIGGIFQLLELQRRDDLPGWQKFALEGKAGIRTIRKMILECEQDQILKDVALEGLQVAVPPIYVAED